MNPPSPLRTHRLNLGWTQQDVAERLMALGGRLGEGDLRLTAATVGRWERQEQPPRPPFPELLCLLFGVSAAELGLGPSPASPDLTEDDGERGSFLRVLPGGLGMPGLAAGDAGAGVARPAHVGTRDLPGRDGGVVAEVQRGIALARHIDDTQGPRAAVPAALAQRELVRTHMQADPPAAVMAELARAAAGVYQLMAWLAYDLNDPGSARSYLEEALGLVRVVGDEGLGSYVLGHLSNLEVAAGRPQTGLALAGTARDRAGAAASAATCAWLAVAEARALATLGERNRTQRALDEALVALARSRPEDEPSWMYYYDEVELQRETGSVLLQLGLAEPARRALLAGLAATDPGLARDRANCLIRLGRTYVLDDELEEACRLGAEALRIAAATGSDRVALQVCRLRIKLGARPSTPMLRELDELISATFGPR